MVFAALMRFISAGHELVVVRGNHDIELHWRVAQRALIEAIVGHAPAHEHEALASRSRSVPGSSRSTACSTWTRARVRCHVQRYGEPLLPTCGCAIRGASARRRFPCCCGKWRATRGVSSAAYDYVGMGAYMTLLQTS